MMPQSNREESIPSLEGTVSARWLRAGGGERRRAPMHQSSLIRLAIYIVLATLTIACTAAPPKAPIVEPMNRSFEEGFPPGVQPANGFYPDQARRLEHTGRVSLAYSVSAKGMTENVSVIESSGYDELDAAAEKTAMAFRFRVPAEWGASGGPSRRYRLGVIFQIVGKPSVPAFATKQPILVITGSALQH